MSWQSELLKLLGRGAKSGADDAASVIDDVFRYGSGAPGRNLGPDMVSDAVASVTGKSRNKAITAVSKRIPAPVRKVGSFVKRHPIVTGLGIGIPSAIYLQSRGSDFKVNQDFDPNAYAKSIQDITGRSATPSNVDLINKLYGSDPYKDLLGGGTSTGQSNEDIVRGMYENPAFGAPTRVGPTYAELLQEALNNPAFNATPTAIDYIGAIEKQNQQNQANLSAYLQGVRGYGKNTADAIATAYSDFSKGTAALGQQQFTDAQQVAANIDQLYRELGLGQAQAAVAPVGEASMVAGLTPAAGEMATAQQTTPAYGASIADYMGREGIISRESLGQMALSQAEQGAGLSQGLLNQIEMAAAMQQFRENQASAQRLAEGRIKQAEYNAQLENSELERKRNILMSMFGAKSQDLDVERQYAEAARQAERDKLSAITNAAISDRDYARSLNKEQRDELIRREDRLFEAGRADIEAQRPRVQKQESAAQTAIFLWDLDANSRDKLMRQYNFQDRESFINFAYNNPEAFNRLATQLNPSILGV